MTPVAFSPRHAEDAAEETHAESAESAESGSPAGGAGERSETVGVSHAENAETAEFAESIPPCVILMQTPLHERTIAQIFTRCDWLQTMVRSGPPRRAERGFRNCGKVWEMRFRCFEGLTRGAAFR